MILSSCDLISKQYHSNIEMSRYVRKIRAVMEILSILHKGFLHIVLKTIDLRTDMVEKVWEFLQIAGLT